MSDRVEFEKRNAVPEKAIWSENKQGYYWSNYPTVAHLFNDKWEVWQEALEYARANGTTVPMTRIAESKVRQLGGDVCGVLVRKDGKLAAVDEHGRVQWLQSGQEWVKCCERLPTEEDEYVWLYFEDHGVSEVLWRWDDDIGAHGETRWKPTGLKRPQPPVQGGEK